MVVETIKALRLFFLLPMLDNDNIDANIPQVALEHHDASSDEQ